MTEIAEVIAQEIFSGFERYKNEFERITTLAKIRFETRDWKNLKDEFAIRLYLHKDEVGRVIEKVLQNHGTDCLTKNVWIEVKKIYGGLAETREDIELTHTFFNSVTRKLFLQIEADPDYEFMQAHEFTVYDIDPDTLIEIEDENSLVKMTTQILERFRFERYYFNMEEDALLLAKRIFEEMESHYSGVFNIWKIEMLNVYFFRNKKAYLIGRILTKQSVIPVIIPMINTELGIVADTILLREEEIEIIFSFTRSYFLADIRCPSKYIKFLKSIMPNKDLYEIYNSMGYNKHGKTLLFQDLMAHTRKTHAKFEIAPGVKGMVMSVFLLPDYDIVFKIIKDEFDPPKTVTRDEVIEKYRVVYKHGRMGRLADTHEFEYVHFRKDQFTPELLEELLSVAGNSVKVKGDKVVIRQLFTERKMRPLNLYLEEASFEDAKKAVIDYGYSLKDLAYANIFPGDLLTKNFGVTRLGRVVFYDYDEITRITDCNFREMPVPENLHEIYAAKPYYEVKSNDIFPAEFKNFLIPQGSLREAFIQHHPDLFEVEFWNRIKKLHQADEFMDVLPYDNKKRFRNISINS
jgi:isocitrate dehydrogenase kinase/phosphatase